MPAKPLFDRVKKQSTARAVLYKYSLVALNRRGT